MICFNGVRQCAHGWLQHCSVIETKNVCVCYFHVCRQCTQTTAHCVFKTVFWIVKSYNCIKHCLCLCLYMFMRMCVPGCIHTLIYTHLLQYATQLVLVFRAGSFPFHPQEQLRLPVGFQSEQVDDALPQGPLGRRGRVTIL